MISDKISQWDRLDSAGYSLPYTVTGKSFYGDSIPVNGSAPIVVDNVLKSHFDLNSNRLTAFIQDTWRLGDSSSSRFTFNYGL
ncbi:hypothetical protein, partial [Streptomyces galilaeus]|uniref:hypothetical protein n=1 Tax=Streptomyces galilaeus TaxID=33899 RepID=UPI0038F70D34